MEDYKDIQERLKKLEDLTSFIERNMQLGRFRLDSHEENHFQLITDANSGLVFTSDGNALFGTNRTSHEVVGEAISPDDTVTPAKQIKAVRGNIRIVAENGNISIEGKNVTINATDPLGGQVYIGSTKTTQIDSPNTKIQGDNFTAAVSNTYSTTATFQESDAQLSNEVTTATDELSASFFGKILSAIKRFKKFFESICGQ